MSVEKKPPLTLRVVAETGDFEKRFQIKNFSSYLDAINAARAIPNGRGKAKTPLSTGREWKMFFESSKFIEDGKSIAQSAIEAMKKDKGIKDKNKADIISVAVTNAVTKHKISIQPIPPEVEEKMVELKKSLENKID